MTWFTDEDVEKAYRAYLNSFHLANFGKPLNDEELAKAVKRDPKGADETRSNIRDALSAINPYEWRPIETAPKTPDELRKIYGDTFQNEIIVGRPDEPYGAGHIMGCSTTARWQDGKWVRPIDPTIRDILEKEWSEVVNPTGWLPLPPAPEGDK